MVDLPYRDEQGQIVGLLHMVQDCTEAGVLKQHLSQSRNELRLAQELLTGQNLELASANTELRRLDELKSTFVAVAAHELRTPLTAIQGYAEMLVDHDVGTLSDRQREYLLIVQSSALRLSHVANSLLDVTRGADQSPSVDAARCPRPSACPVRPGSDGTDRRQPSEQRDQVHAPGGTHRGCHRAGTDRWVLAGVGG
jgi:signal transduction histidine kinase